MDQELTIELTSGEKINFDFTTIQSSIDSIDDLTNAIIESQVEQTGGVGEDFFNDLRNQLALAYEGDSKQLFDNFPLFLFLVQIGVKV